ncbi:MAG: NAD(P)/FAD-dependent oxidoreductase [Eubacteriales bacterium]|nr:NAD(P)/FAD-dependent oxidoreductase [Eubacteriales bacterium]MDD4323802.1 NAD(P)/FAD-dependent oxidoreductase [Eubacteriales bacterium]MDD4541678.1 NAD(P)/FAD-dependent oxidoreductase [Eubacteriales bacterium]
MISIPLLIVGAGPAGLCAAYRAAEVGVDVLILDRAQKPGGQLVKQTHKFFGSEKQFASTRGIEIADILFKRLEDLPGRVELLTDATVIGFYEDGVVTAEVQGKFMKYRPEACIVATGASEKTLAFTGNDLPGVYGAGAVQTLMNEYGVRPGNRVLMIGAGNIGLIVSYQLLQAGVQVAAILDAADEIGGYLVHASKIRRAGVPILTRHTVGLAYGDEKVEHAIIHALDDEWNKIPGSEQQLDVDVICVAVGLSPLADLLWQAAVDMKYIGALGGYVPLRNSDMMTSVAGLYIAGDVAGIEEASSAMVEGEIAGISAAGRLGFSSEESHLLKKDCLQQLRQLRAGPGSEKIRTGMALAGAYV